jgi:hypothetical protein
MRIFTLLIILLLSVKVLPAYSGEFEEIEIVIDRSSVLTSRCVPASRTCYLYPLEGTTSHEFEKEINLIEPHLSGMGVKIKRDFLWNMTSLVPLIKEKQHLTLSWDDSLVSPLTLEERIAE